MDKSYEKSQTPATPAISLIQALNVQMDRILAEGPGKPLAAPHRHGRIYARLGARSTSAFTAMSAILSNTVTNIENTRGIQRCRFEQGARQRGAVISNGYGDLKEKCFRIAHMGDLTLADMQWLTAQIDDILGL